jgi:hypothetical protein
MSTRPVEVSRMVFPDHITMPDAGAADVAVSVLVSARGLAESLTQSYHEYAAALRGAGLTFEFLFLVDRRATELTRSLIELATRAEPVRVLYTEQSVSNTLLIRSAVEQSRGEVVLMLPTVPRVVASSLPLLVERVRGGVDIAVACREPRRSTWRGRARSRVFHYCLERVTGARLNDILCGVRAIRRDVFDEVPLYGDLAPYLPLLAARDGFRVEELRLPQHAADRSTGFHGPKVHLRKLMDLLNLFFLLRFAERPLRFFGLTGGVAAITGVVLLAVLFVQRLGGQPLANRPILVLAVLLVILGIQAIALGLIGEVIVHLHSSTRRPYRVMRADRDDAQGARVHVS